jgi:short subunit dehydrogenase-like uncharacterized protein
LGHHPDGGLSGGTLASLKGQIDEIRSSAAAGRLARDPYALAPDPPEGLPDQHALFAFGHDLGVDPRRHPRPGQPLRAAGGDQPAAG